MQGNWENLENSFWWSGSPKIWGGRGDGQCIRPPIFCICSPQCNREKFKGKMTKKVVRNSENVDIFGGPRTETKFVKWSATRKRLRTAVLALIPPEKCSSLLWPLPGFFGFGQFHLLRFYKLISQEPLNIK